MNGRKALCLAHSPRHASVLLTHPLQQSFFICELLFGRFRPVALMCKTAWLESCGTMLQLLLLLLLLLLLWLMLLLRLRLLV